MVDREPDNREQDHRKRRKRAAVGVLLSGMVAGLWVAFVLTVWEEGRRFMRPGVGIPLVPFLYFLMELITGRSFGELADAWEDLEGWQRGVFGCLAVIGTVALAGLALAVILTVPGV